MTKEAVIEVIKKNIAAILINTTRVVGRFPTARRTVGNPAFDVKKGRRLSLQFSVGRGLVPAKHSSKPDPRAGAGSSKFPVPLGRAG